MDPDNGIHHNWHELMYSSDLEKYSILQMIQYSEGIFKSEYTKIDRFILSDSWNYNYNITNSHWILKAKHTAPDTLS